MMFAAPANPAGAILPWGRTFEEYTAMFALSRADLASRILACADGPASFNAHQAGLGVRVVSVDPIYRLSADEIADEVNRARPQMIEHCRRNPQRFVWKHVRTPDELAELRIRTLRDFLADYAQGRAEGRYLAQSLPHLDFLDDSFDLALCSHFLFLYSADLSLEFHLQSISEMCRVAREVRIFPLLDMNAEPSVHLPAVLDAMRSNGLDARLETVDYEFLRGANQMLRIKPPQA
jgi:SAM-dependent methyltransferase